VKIECREEDRQTELKERGHRDRQRQGAREYCEKVEERETKRQGEGERER